MNHRGTFFLVLIGTCALAFLQHYGHTKKLKEDGIRYIARVDDATKALRKVEEAILRRTAEINSYSEYRPPKPLSAETLELLKVEVKDWEAEIVATETTCKTVEEAALLKDLPNKTALNESLKKSRGETTKLRNALLPLQTLIFEQALPKELSAPHLRL